MEPSLWISLQKWFSGSGKGWRSERPAHAVLPTLESLGEANPWGRIGRVRVRPQLDQLEERIVPSMDRIYTATSFPYSAAVHIVATFNDGTYIGSGAMVDGTHVLTAGHMVFDLSH